MAGTYRTVLPLIEPALSGYEQISKSARAADDLKNDRVSLRNLIDGALEQQKGAGRLLLVVDQWEELYTQCEDSTERQQFIQQILAATDHERSPLTVVLTVRADFYHQLLQDRTLLDQLQDGKLDLGPMTPEELREAIEKPATTMGLTFQAGLVDRLLGDAREEPGRLPLLEFALEELWKRHNSGQLTHRAYDALGRLSGAIAEHAERVYAKLDEGEQQAAPALFRRLVRAGSKTEEDTRRRADLPSLDEVSQRIVRRLADERLLVTTRIVASGEISDDEAVETVEVAQEELLRRWSRLSKWIDADRKFLQWRGRLAPDLERFQHDRTALLRAGALREARKFYPARDEELEPSEQTFLKASLATARRQTAVRIAALVVLIATGMVIRASVVRQQEATRIEGLVGRLVSAEPNQIPDIVKELDANPRVAAAYLSPLLSKSSETPDDNRAQLHARLATVARDPSLVEPLREELLTGKVTYVVTIRQHLRLYAGELTEQLWAILRDESAAPSRRFRAALARSDYVPESEGDVWANEDLKFVAEQLVSSNAEFQPLLRDALRSIREKLLAALEQIFSEAEATDAQRLSAANAFADYFTSDVAKLLQLLTVATPEQFAVLYPLVTASPLPGIEYLGQIAAALPPEELGSVERVHFGQRRANTAVTLLRLGELEKVQPVFDMTDDPEALTQFIFRCRDRGVPAEALLDLLEIVTHRVSEGSVPKEDIEKLRSTGRARYALLLAMGEYGLEEIPKSRRAAFLNELANWYRHDPRSAVHGAAGWLLRQWGADDIAREVDQTPVPYSPDREWFTLAVEVEPQPKKFFYTFIVFPAGEYMIGSVEDEPDRSVRASEEQRHGVKLTRPFALLDREITFEELITFSPQYTDLMQQVDTRPVDAGFGADWYDSVSFCRWLGAQMGLPEADQPYADPESLDMNEYPREPDPRANWAPRNWPLMLGRRGFRLPTESEWEVATRAGTRTSYGYGSDVALLDRFGWFVENSGKRVHRPRELRPNLRGLFDLHGNLFNWTHDWFADFSSATITDPLGIEVGSNRVYRGGSWSDTAGGASSADRGGIHPTFRVNSLGFRLALSPLGPESGAPGE